MVPLLKILPTLLWFLQLYVYKIIIVSLMFDVGTDVVSSAVCSFCHITDT